MTEPVHTEPKPWGDHYLVFPEGRVWSNKMNRWVSFYLDEDGYRRASLYKEGKRIKVGLAGLVILCFVENPNPELFDQPNHLDKDKENNHYLNLEWSSHHTNHAHRVKDQPVSRTGLRYVTTTRYLTYKATLRIPPELCSLDAAKPHNKQRIWCGPSRTSPEIAARDADSKIKELGLHLAPYHKQLNYND